MKHFAFCLMLMFSFFMMASCQNSKKDRITELVKEWEGKEILFPKNSVFTIQGKDTVDFDFSDADYKIVTYVDSTGCTSCKMQLPKWNEFMSIANPLNINIAFLFYINSKRQENMTDLMCKQHFSHPVCFDELDTFNKLNKLPKELAFHTFLLDKENRVVLIGNPILNPKIKKVYLKLLTNNNISSTEITHQQTTATIDKKIINWGKFNYKEPQRGVVILRNTGHYPLKIYDIITSCTCTHVKYDNTTILPNEEIVIEISYQSDGESLFQEAVNIYCNVKESPLHLKVMGEGLTTD